MNFFNIMAEAVLSIEKSCLVAHTFEHICQQCGTPFKKVKREDVACAVFYEAYRQIHVSTTQFACIPSKD